MTETTFLQDNTPLAVLSRDLSEVARKYRDKDGIAEELIFDTIELNLKIKNRLIAQAKVRKEIHEQKR